MRFGTDGIRGIYPDQLNESTARELAAAMTAVCPGCVAVVGRDTRVSGETLAQAVCEGLARRGGIAVDVGIIPTAAVAYLTARYGADFGVVVSASHNPPEFNGLKVFRNGGCKLSDDEERAIENAVPSDREVNGGRVIRAPFAADAYCAMLSDGRDLRGMRVLLDCAHGAACTVAARAFEAAGASVTAKNSSAKGEKINENCGALYAQRLAAAAADYDVAFAFDGDADRVIALRPDGAVVNGDHIVAILAADMHKSGQLAHDTAVGTIMTNTGVERTLARKGVSLVRTAVGDKYVLQAMIEGGYCLGGEQAGHVILSDILPTGDGILTALSLCGVMKRRVKTLFELDDARDLPQCELNIPIARERVFEPKFVVLCDKIRAARPDCRIVVRPSGTEPVVRILAECEDAARAAEAAEEIAAALRSGKA